MYGELIPGARRRAGSLLRLGKNAFAVGAVLAVTFMPFLGDGKAAGSVLGVGAIMSFVIGIYLLANVLPGAYTQWTNQTKAGGSMADAASSDKSVWNLGGLIMVALGVLMLYGHARRG